MLEWYFLFLKYVISVTNGFITFLGFVASKNFCFVA